MQTFNTQFEHELRKVIEARMVEIAEILTAGQAIKTLDDYRKFVGEFQGLKQVIDSYCGEVNTTLSKR